MDRRDAPRQGDEGAPDGWLVLDGSVVAGLDGLTVGAEIVVLTWLDRSVREVLRTRPRDDPNRPEQGVFTTRSPDRPNPIGLHEVTVLAIDGPRVHVNRMEALDGTPILDIKPALPASRPDDGVGPAEPAACATQGVPKSSLRGGGRMAEVGDRVEMASSKAGQPPRAGVVSAIAGSLVTVEWDSGETTRVVPGPGVMTVVGGRPTRTTSARRSPVKRTRTRTTSAAATKTSKKRPSPAKRTATTKKAAAVTPKAEVAAPALDKVAKKDKDKKKKGKKSKKGRG